MPQLVRLYIRQVLIGFGLSAAFVALLMYFDVARLWTLISATNGGWVALFLLFFFNGLVFAGVQFAIRVMGMAQTDDDQGGTRDDLRPAPAPAPVPVPVRVVDRA
jgi:hypothetical protein